MSDILKNLQDDLRQVEEKFAAGGWTDRINEIAAECRRIGSEYSQQGHIKGFVLEINGVDASHPVRQWPQVAFEADCLTIKMAALIFGKPEYIKIEIKQPGAAPEVEAPKIEVLEVKPAEHEQAEAPVLVPFMHPLDDDFVKSDS